MDRRVLDEDLRVRASFLTNPTDERTLSQIQLIQHRIRTTWFGLLQHISPDQCLWFIGDFQKGTELCIVYGSTHPLSGSVKSLRGLRIFKRIADPFDDYYCKISYLDGSEEIDAEDYREVLKMVRNWISNEDSRPDPPPRFSLFRKKSRDVEAQLSPRVRTRVQRSQSCQGIEPIERPVPKPISASVEQFRRSADCLSSPRGERKRSNTDPSQRNPDVLTSVDTPTFSTPELKNLLKTKRNGNEQKQ